MSESRVDGDVHCITRYIGFWFSRCGQPASHGVSLIFTLLPISSHQTDVVFRVGLVTATVASEVNKSAQPALLYLVPFTLLPLITMAYIKVSRSCSTRKSCDVGNVNTRSIAVRSISDITSSQPSTLFIRPCSEPQAFKKLEIFFETNNDKTSKRRVCIRCAFCWSTALDAVDIQFQVFTHQCAVIFDKIIVWLACLPQSCKRASFWSPNPKSQDRTWPEPDIYFWSPI